ncbi:hypothetical protein FRUB_02002 [Fimbriiglobus ruber]|uniref:Uncharacterized protein n=1 Tax=Fimbriiglobus ruber TaxID=1908690 RepID=A0A225DWA2_9BACT|nr:hypothetical protein FRUB_02002 [Fimbriiglobus ruber]
MRDAERSASARNSHNFPPKNSGANPDRSRRPRPPAPAGRRPHYFVRRV